MNIRQRLSKVFSPWGATPGAFTGDMAGSSVSDRLDQLDDRLTAVQLELDSLHSALDSVSKMAMRTERKVYRDGRGPGDESDEQAATEPEPAYPSPYQALLR